jgi:signal transduction histidine kinase
MMGMTDIGGTRGMKVIKGGFWWRMLAVSLLITLVSAGISLIIFHQASAPVSQESRRNVYLFLANIMESAPYPEALRAYERFHADSPSIGRSIWVLSDDGRVLASNSGEAPPAEWLTMARPQVRHAMTVKVPRFGYFADLVLVRLDKVEPTWLLVRPEKGTPNKTLAGVEFELFFLSLLGTAFASFAAVFFYLRHTSTEARQVMARLHAGELDARFPIARVDQIGSLKLDFNAMADEIERLVKRLTASEAARKQMLAELSHDLRTPLTSLRTAIETLKLYRAQMSAEQQDECLRVAESELIYFVRLLEDLLLIATVSDTTRPEPAPLIDAKAILERETGTRRTTHPTLDWRFTSRLTSDTQASVPLAMQEQIFLRMLRNALDNAAKYARSRVDIVLTCDAGKVRLQIDDDGPGMDDEARKQFGQRAQRRKLRSDGDGSSADPSLSLGLGSVIIRAIVEAHGGCLELRSPSDRANTGTSLLISLPEALQLGA